MNRGEFVSLTISLIIFKTRIIGVMSMDIWETFDTCSQVALLNSCSNSPYQKLVIIPVSVYYISVSIENYYNCQYIESLLYVTMLCTLDALFYLIFTKHCKLSIIVPILQMRKLGPREIHLLLPKVK